MYLFPSARYSQSFCLLIEEEPAVPGVPTYLHLLWGQSGVWLFSVYSYLTNWPWKSWSCRRSLCPRRLVLQLLLLCSYSWQVLGNKWVGFFFWRPCCGVAPSLQSPGQTAMDQKAIVPIYWKDKLILTFLFHAGPIHRHKNKHWERDVWDWECPWLFKQNSEKVDGDGAENTDKVRSLGTTAVNYISKNNNNRGRQRERGMLNDQSKELGVRRRLRTELGRKRMTITGD